MNLIAGSERPSRNSQGIHSASLQPPMPTTLLPETLVSTRNCPTYTSEKTHQLEAPPLKETIPQS